MVLIGEGTYGKVYRPSLPCGSRKSLQNRKDIVGKVFSDKDYYNREVELATKVQEMNVNNEFSIPFYKTCKENLQIMYKDGGSDLYDYMVEHPGASRFSDIMGKMRFLCKGIKVLLEHNLVHLDIKLENIVYNGDRLYLIDFGLMSPEHIVYKRPSLLKYDYIPYPPEFKRYERGESYIKYFNKNFENTHLLSYIKKFYKTWMIDLDALRRKPTYPTEKLDIYSLGMVFVQLYKWSKKTDVRIEELICGMICFDPVKRWDIDQVLAWFDKNS